MPICGPRQLSHRLEPSTRRLPCRVGYHAGWSTIPGAVWWDTHQRLCFDLGYPCDVLQYCSTSLSRCAKSIHWATHTRQRTRHGTALHEALMTRARDAPTARNGQRCAFRSAPCVTVRTVRQVQGGRWPPYVWDIYWRWPPLLFA
jgi:hypothetical protein